MIFILNSPNNPSGTICKNLKELAKVAKKYKIIILSDEIYTDLTFVINMSLFHNIIQKKHL